MDEIVSFGEWVQARRNQLGLTRAGLAHQVGCSPVTIKKIERDERRPSLQIAELLAEHLQIPEAEQENFMRRARGEFVPTLISPDEMTLAEAQAPVKEEDTPKHNLPPQTTPFFGREQELADIASKLADPNCRLLTILGGGGMGKTRLAIEAGQRHAADLQFTDGVTFVALAPIGAERSDNEVNPLAGAVADALKISFHAQGTPEEQLFTYLRRKEMLIIFDNFEHLVETAVFLSNLLTHAPDIKILTTSRERLNLQEEWLFALHGLSYSEDGTSAMQLFAQRAKQVQASFDVEGEKTAVFRICQLVEGMPLGLELAASWVIQLTCQEIADEIEAEIDFLTTEVRNIPDRHRSIRAVFGYSWDKLTPKERDVLQKLSVFRGGFERNAAKAVAGASLSILGRLVGKSLLSVGENGRYAIHELLRQFAAEALSQSAEAETQTRNHHSGFYLKMLHDQEPNLVGAEAKMALVIIRNDIDNIREAWRWGTTYQPEQLSLEMLHSLFLFYEIEGWYLESKNVFERAAQLQKERCLPMGTDNINVQSCLNLGLMQTIQAFACLRLGQFDLAESIFRESLSLFEAIGQKDHWVGVMCQVMLGVALHHNNKLTLAYACFQEAMEAQQTLDNQYIRALVLCTFGQFYLTFGQYDEAGRLSHESNHILASFNNQFLRPFNLSTLGRVAMVRGHYGTAEAYHQEALTMRVNMDSRSGIAYTWSDLADVTLLQGKFDEAQHYLQQMLTFDQEHQMGFGVDATNLRLGRLAAAQGNDKLAKQHLAQMKSRVNNQRWTDSGAGWAYLETQDIETARRIFLADLQTMKTANRPPVALDVIAGLAHLKALAGSLSHALELVALVLNHPATTQVSKDQIVALKEELVAELPADVVLAAKARGREMDLWETAELLLVHRQTSIDG